MAVPAVLLLAAGILLRPLSLGMTGFALGGGGVTLLFNCLFLTGYLSLVRRVRSGTLWTNSVLNLLVSAARKALRGRKATTKMMLSYGSFLLLNLLFLCLGFLGLFLAVLFDVGVGGSPAPEGSGRNRKDFGRGSEGADSCGTSGRRQSGSGGSGEPDGKRPFCGGGKKRQG